MYLVKTYRVEAKAQIEKPNGNTIKDAKEDDSLHINRFCLEEIQPLSHM